MINKKYFGFVMGMWMMVVLALSMSIVVLLLNTGKLPFIPLMISTLEAFCVNFLSSLIIPANKLGKMFAKKWGAKENSFIFEALSNLIVTGIYVTIVSFAMTLINVGFTPVLILAWLSIYPVVFVVGYIIVLVVSPIAFKLTTQIVKD